LFTVKRRFAVLVEVRIILGQKFIKQEVKHEGDSKIIGSRRCYPPRLANRPDLTDCVFTSGIVMREYGKADLYSGLGDCETGRITIEYPFAGYGEMV
jgi:predicted small secreted protein